MVNSALKNAMARRNHKERAQPLHRQRLGLLEKHKDYVHRARDYRSKQDRIRTLREKAAFRNKDEFYFGMVKGQTKGGVAVGDRGNEALGADVVKLLKTQDAGYIRLQIAKDVKHVAKLRRELEVTAPAPAAGEDLGWNAAAELAEVDKLAEMGVVLRPRKGKATAAPAGHLVFADKDEFESFTAGPSAGPSTGPSTAATDKSNGEETVDLGWADPEPKRSKRATASVAQQDSSSGSDTVEAVQAARAHRVALLTALSAHLARLRQLRQAEQKLATTQGLLGKGAARKVRPADDASPPEDGDRKRQGQGKLWKWKLERTR